MDSFEANKIFGALLGTVFVLFGGSLVAENIFHSEIPETPGYAIEAPEPTEGGAAAPAAVPIATLLQTADAEAGATVFRRCQACHSNEDGAPASVGPHLWNVVNREVAHDPGFSYSAGMTAFAEGGAVMWDYEHLNGFLINPRGYVSGTAMSFAGIQNDGDRANLIAYLRTLSNEPAPLPEAPAEGEEAAAAEGGAPADGAAPAEGGEAAAPAEGEAAAPAGGEAAPVGTTNEAAPATDQPQAPAQSDSSAAGAPVAEPGTVGTATEGMPPAGQNQANPGDGTNADAPAGAAPAEQPAVPGANEAAPTANPAPAEQPAAAPATTDQPAAAPAPAAPAAGTTIVPAPAAGTPAQ